MPMISVMAASIFSAQDETLAQQAERGRHFGRMLSVLQAIIHRTLPGV